MQAGIPDFRSSDGLFQTIKRDNPNKAVSSGKELFDVSVFNVSFYFTGFWHFKSDHFFLSGSIVLHESTKRFFSLWTSPVRKQNLLVLPNDCAAF